PVVGGQARAEVLLRQVPHEPDVELRGLGPDHAVDRLVAGEVAVLAALPGRDHEVRVLDRQLPFAAALAPSRLALAADLDLAELGQPRPEQRRADADEIRRVHRTASRRSTCRQCLATARAAPRARSVLRGSWAMTSARRAIPATTSRVPSCAIRLPSTRVRPGVEPNIVWAAWLTRLIRTRVSSRVMPASPEAAERPRRPLRRTARAVPLPAGAARQHGDTR